MPIISLTGTAIQPQTKARRSKVNIYGLPTDFGQLWQTPSALPLDPDQREASTDHLQKTGNQLFPSVMLNRTLQQELQVEVGDTIVLSFERPTNIHREFILGRREYEDLVQSLRLTVTQVITDQGSGRFGLQSSQHFPANAYLDLEFLQQVVDREIQAKTVLLSVPGPDSTDLVAIVTAFDATAPNDPSQGIAGALREFLGVTEKDTDNNGKIDTAFLDDDEDGLIEGVLIDKNEN